MSTITLNVDDETDAALTAVCAAQGRRKADVIADLLRRYLETERLNRMLRDPQLMQLYNELSEEDVAIAEESISEYKQILNEADKK